LLPVLIGQDSMACGNFAEWLLYPTFVALALARRSSLHAKSAARTAGCSLLWCNARTGALSFYEQFGWSISSDEFDIPTVGPHRRMLRTLSIANPA
jgi:hypothetical protein